MHNGMHCYTQKFDYKALQVRLLTFLSHNFSAKYFYKCVYIVCITLLLLHTGKKCIMDKCCEKNQKI